MANDLFDIRFDTKTLKKLLKESPRRFARAFGSGALRALRRYGGFHRKRRMRRETIAERHGIFATRGGQGLSQQRHIRVKELKGSRLSEVGAEAKISNIIFRQLEAGATIRAPQGKSLLLPGKEHRTKKGKASARAKRLLSQKRVRRIKTKNRGTFLVHFPGYPRKAAKSGRKRRRRTATAKRRALFLFILRDQVTIPKRTQFKELFVREYPRRVVQAIQHEWNRLVDRLNRGN